MRVGVHRKLIARVKIPPLRVLVARTVAGRAALHLLDKICREAPAIVIAAKVAETDKPSLAGIRDERRRGAEVIMRIQRAAGFVDDALHVGK